MTDTTPKALKAHNAAQNDSEHVDAATPDSGPNGGPEGNATLRRVWDEPGGEADAYRQSVSGQANRDEDHSELTAAETPETTRHLSDASLSPDDKDATAEAIERATSVTGKDGN